VLAIDTSTKVFTKKARFPKLEILENPEMATKTKKHR